VNQFDLRGRNAIVTGTAKGIGAAIGRRLLESGASVALWDIDAERLAEKVAQLEAVGEAAAHIVDVTDPRSINQAAERCIAAFGRVDILVNNAGTVGTLGKVWEQPLENWERMLWLNLTGTFLCCQALVEHMMAHGYGRIVNIASNAGKMGVQNNAPYAASKAGVISLTKSLAKETAATGVLVNAICPGGVNTDLFTGFPDSYKNQIGSGVPMGRLVEADKVAALAVWLASEDCSFTTGAVHDISGGRADY
jgi:NAD(P)-dependent dehydrogenase (short-subunit alcohol dehydrogenase family)